MRLPSSLSIALASGQKTPTNTPRTDSTSDNSDSGSNSDQGHDRYNSRSLIKKHLTWSRHTSPSRRKTHSQQQQQQQQTQTPNSAAASTIKTRSRGASGSASLLRNGGHTETGPERSPRRVDARGLVPDNDPPPSSTTAVIEQSFIASTARPPLPHFHSRQRVPARDELLAASPVTDLRNCTLADRHLAGQQRSRSSTMALKFLSGHSTGGSSSSVKHFDIRLDNDYIVFRGGEDEAASAQLAGSVVLCVTEPLNISHVQLTLSGIIHMSYCATSASSMSGKKNSYKEKTFFEKTWPFKVAGKEKTLMLLPDNYEWPFDCILEGGLPESVEGLKDAWIIYRLKAEIGRKRGKDIVVRKPLRIVRTLDPSALELAHAMSVENIWPNKIEYSISIPSKAIIFGSFLRVDFKLIPLLKGLVIGQITTQVREEQEFVVDPEWGLSALGGGLTKNDRTIASDTYTINAESDEQIIDEAAEGFQFTRFIELPKSLHQCMQDCNVKGIKIRHKAKFNVQLHNPDGHISELRANLPVAFYISPNLPINENNDLVDQSPQASRAAIENDMNNSAPPLYGQHMLDKLYSEVDPSGYLTPGIGMSTPGTPYLRSRQPSSENLRSLDAIASSHGTTPGINTPNGGSVNPHLLHHRLQNLDVSAPGPSTPPNGLPADLLRRHSDNSANDQPTTDGYFSPHDGPPPPGTHDSSGVLSRRESEEDADGIASGARTPFAQYAHMEDLARLPSYSTAVKAPAPHGNTTEGLPTYGAVVVEGDATPPLEAPATAHVRGVRGTFVAGRSPPMNRNLSSLQDDERRLRLMQARGR